MAETLRLQTMEMLKVPMLAECLACGHRGALDGKTIRSYSARANSLTTLQSLSERLVCTVCRGRATAKTTLPVSTKEVAPFLGGEVSGRTGA